MARAKNRRNPPGIKTTRVTAADGRRVVYYYHRTTNKRIKGEPGTPEFYENWVLAGRAEKPERPQSTLTDLLHEFQAAPEFKKLRAVTRRDYERFMKFISAEFGSMPIGALDDPKVRAVFLEWRDSMADRPKTADYAMTVLNRVLNWAKDRRAITHNHAAGAGRLYKANRAAKIWTQNDIQKFCEVSPKTHAQAVRLAAATGLARGDLVRLTWAQIGSDAIGGERQKTGESYAVPLLPETRAVLRELERKSPCVLTNTHGRPWRDDALSLAVRRGCVAAGIEGLSLHDLRGTFATRLLAAGLKHGQIARVMGWSERTVETLSRAYIDGATVSGEVIKLLERQTNEMRQKL